MSNQTIPVLSLEGEKVSERKADEKIFAVSAGSFLISQAAKKYLSNQRMARAKTKTRSDVIGSGAKIWRQKGTGRARHGDRKANLFVGGGVSHGPTGTQNFKQRLNQKMTEKAIFSLLSDKLKEKKLFLLPEFELKNTRQAAAFLKKAKEKLGVRKQLSLVQFKEPQIKRFFGNIKDLTILEASCLSVYDLLNSPFILMTTGALGEVEKRFK